MFCPITLVTPIRVAFHYKDEFIVNITAFEYHRIEAQRQFSLIVIDNTDLITGFLSAKAYVNNEY